MTREAVMTEAEEMFAIAMAILEEVRLAPGPAFRDQSREMESEWAEWVIGMCHVWGDFYGPATSPHLARALAHRYLDRQGGNLEYLRQALRDFGHEDRRRPS